MIGDLFKYWTYQVFSPGTVLKEKYEAFRMLLEHDQQAHEGMAELQRICFEALPVDANRIYASYNDFSHAVGRIVDLLGQMCPGCYSDLKVYHAKFDQYIRYLLQPPAIGYLPDRPHTLSLSRVTENDSHQVGGKAGVLMEVGGRLQLPVPQGFVITTNAFLYLIDYNRLRPAIDKALARIHPDDPSTFASVSKILTAAMMDIDIPTRLENDIQDELGALLGRCQGEPLLAVRSSAVAEDSDTTFAGQYLSCLNVEPTELLKAYRKVLASKFEPAALYYRIHAGLEDAQTPMAVMVMEMLDPEVSGVVYTRGPTPDMMETLSIHYVRGFGEDLVSGRRPASVLTIPRGLNGDRHLPQVSDTADDVLDRETATTLVRWALQLEGLLGRPCDIEWCRCSSDKPVLLQCRPLLTQPQPARSIGLKSDPVDRTAAKLLYQGGVCACAGIGCGPVHKIDGEADLAGVPQNSVALMTSASPRTISILDRVNAVVLEGGSVAGHFQTVAREFNIPTLVQAENANTVLARGDHVTVDAGKGEIYAGCSQNLATDNRQLHPDKNGNPLLRKLDAAMSFITPLELIDPYAPTFTPQSCRSMHDILRFSHEKAVYEMFAIGDRRLKRKKGARRLVGELPMVIYVLDVGGGIHAAKASNPTIRIEDVICEPMHALWDGLLHPDIQWAGHHHFDWAEYDRLVMNGGIISPESAMLSSYAVVSKRYLNFCLKFGYHFAIIDTLFQTPPKTGHVWFRFTGGGGDPQGRVLRVQFIRRVLEALGFNVKTEGDLVNARRDAQDNASIAQGLLRIGHLLGVTRLLDMHLQDEQAVERLEASFLNQTFADFIFE
ncbi:MAG: PEP/pyruvate-binding domain-containing protein [Desulfobacteraceae bacterium]|jgi:pyruvate,water dikinase